MVVVAGDANSRVKMRALYEDCISIFTHTYVLLLLFYYISNKKPFELLVRKELQTLMW